MNEIIREYIINFHEKINYCLKEALKRHGIENPTKEDIDSKAKCIVSMRNGYEADFCWGDKVLVTVRKLSPPAYGYKIEVEV